MIRLLFIFLLFFNVFFALSQNSTIETDFTVQDYGKLENINNIQSEFIIKNNGTKNLYVLRADAKQGIKVRINKKTIPPGDTSTLYVYIEPKTTGRFNEEIKIVTSADALPFILYVKGDVKSIKGDDKTACFYFNKPKKRVAGNYPPIQFPATIPKKHSDSVAIPDTIVAIPDTIKKVEAIKPIVPEPPKEELDRRIYKPNNITFLIDVSTSMKDSMKLPLMKQAMYALISALRDIDNVNVITYSDSARIIKEGVKGDEKTILRECVSKLKAKGPTMGAEAILFSLDIALKNYLDTGNNQLFLITDGVFKFADEHYQLWKEKVGDKNIALSIIALGSDKQAMTQLQAMATKRKGSFMWIKNRGNAKTIVLDEIKKRAKK
jgi:hypothetical protein